MDSQIAPITILPGQVQITRSTEELHSNRFMRTVVGTGVSVCIWDRQLLSGVMTNFMYPRPKLGETSTMMFGEISTKNAISMMHRRGSKTEHLIAQILGGSRGDDIWDKTGFENITVARKILQEMKIPIYSEDVGGRMGRKIVFNVFNGNVAVVKVHALRDADWSSNSRGG